MGRVLCAAGVWSLLLAADAAAADVVFENARLRAVLGDDAVWRSLRDKAGGEEYCAADKRVSFAEARVAGKARAANRASLDGQRLTVGLADCDTRLVYAVATADDWIVFRLEGVSGARPSHVTLARLGVAITERVGSCLGAAWNDRYAVCLRGANLQTSGHASRAPGYSLLATTTQDAPGPKLEGSAAALVGAPPAELPAILGRLARAYDAPRNEADGLASRHHPMARQSYWFLGFGEKDADKVIDYCRRAGVRQVMLSCGSWCRSVGHFTFNTALYPDGMESLRRTVARLHEQGILVGMHTFASKVSKTDPYVTPVPDRRFWVDMSATLAEDVGAQAGAIRARDDLSQWPGSPVCRQKVWEGHVTKHQEVILDDEIVRYERIGPEGTWDTFLGCQRGAYGTRAAGHKAGTACRHYAVDGCINGYLIDLDTSLFEEVASRIAEIFNACGFDMVYFDGSEDVDRRRFNYYASKAHAVPLSKFRKRPVIHQGGGFTHELWHSFTRDNTVDQYPGTYLAHLLAGGTLGQWPTCKDHIDRSVRGLIACEDNMTPGELGWFGINPASGNYDGLQYDEIEYLMCRSLAYDAPVSLQTSFASMERHPLTPDILEIVRLYEQARAEKQTPPAALARLKERGKDFVMLPASLRERGAGPEFVEVQALAEPAGTRQLRAFLGPRGHDTVATLWHYLGKEGRLAVATEHVAAYDVKGQAVKIDKSAGRTLIPIDRRRLTLHFAATAPDAARDLLAKAWFEAR